MAERIDVGDVRVLHVIVRNKTGQQTATDVTLTLRKPDGTLAAGTPTEATADDLTAINAANAGVHGWVDLTSTTGVYVDTVGLDQAGVWRFRWAGTGAVTFAEEGSFTVETRRVGEPA